MTLFQSLADALHTHSGSHHKDNFNIFCVDVSMVIDFPLSVDLVVVRGFMAAVFVFGGKLFCVFSPWNAITFIHGGMLTQLSNAGMQALN